MSIVRAFVCPFFMENIPDLGESGYSELERALSAPPYDDGSVQSMQIAPAIVPTSYDENGNPVGGNVPAYGATLIIVRAPSSDVMLELDGIVEVRMLSDGMTESQRNTVETFLRDKGLTSVELNGAITAKAMATRIAKILQPEFDEFPPGWFD